MATGRQVESGFEEERLGFRDQVGIFLGTREVGWLRVREQILGAGGSQGDVSTILGWRLHQEGAEWKARGEWRKWLDQEIRYLRAGWRMGASHVL